VVDQDPSYMHARRATALAAALATVLATGRALAWQEAHEIGDETRVVVDGAGVASEEHRLRWHVQRGPLASIDLARLDPGAVVEPDVAVASDDGRAVVVHAARAAIRDDGTVRITVDDPRALMRGTFTFDVRWRVDMVAAGRVARDGATLRLTWSAPPAAGGLDGVRTTFDLPAAPEAPRPIVAESGLIDDSAAATLTRGAQRDVLELVRPHVPGGESVTWTLRLDGHALPLVTDPRVVPPPEASAGPEPDRVAPLLAGVALAALALGFGLLAWHKARGFAGACLARGIRSRGLLPLPDGPRAVLAGAALAAAVGLEVTGEVTAGAACVSVAVLAAALRAPRATLPVRGPGRWQPVAPEQAFARAAPETRARAAAGAPLFDIDRARGRTAALVAAGLVAVIAAVVRRFDADAAWLAVLDSAVLAPLFVTGRASQMPPHGVRSAAPWLAGAFRRLRRVAGLQVAPWARVAPDGLAADELRLLAMPRMPMPGLIGLEVGLAWSRTPVSWAAAPEVLARFVEGSPAAETLARDLPRARAMLGRRPHERVVRLSPRAPTRASTVALVRALAGALEITPPRSPSQAIRKRGGRPSHQRVEGCVAGSSA
jgi:hypothetical protein